jgi:hypothetical protein
VPCSPVIVLLLALGWPTSASPKLCMTSSAEERSGRSSAAATACASMVTSSPAYGAIRLLKNNRTLWFAPIRCEKDLRSPLQPIGRLRDRRERLPA